MEIFINCIISVNFFVDLSFVWFLS